MSSQVKEDSTQIVVPLEGVSDGNEDFWPEESTTRYEAADDTSWCYGLAMMWMRDIGVLGEIGASKFLRHPWLYASLQARRSLGSQSAQM